MRKFIIPFIIIMSAIALWQTAQSQSYHLMLRTLYKDTVPVVKPGQLAKELQEKQLVLLDVRTPREYEISHLPQARFINYDTFSEADVASISKEEPVVVYCSVGFRSERIGEKLQELGYTNVRNLYGGIFEWVNQEYPIYNEQGQTKQVHAFSKTWGVWLQKGEKVYE